MGLFCSAEQSWQACRESSGTVEKSLRAFRDMTEVEQAALVQCVQAHATKLQEQAHMEFRGWCHVKMGKQHDMHPLSVASIAERAWLEALGARVQIQSCGDSS